MAAGISPRRAAGSSRPARGRRVSGLFALAACGGLLGCSLFGCSLLAPSDEELLGSKRGVGGAAGGGGSGGSLAGSGGSLASAGGSVAGSGGSLEGSVVLPVGGIASSLPAGPTDALPSPPDAGSTLPPVCVDCERIRITSGVETVRLGGPGGSLSMDICPHDQVVVGMDFTFDVGSPADFGYVTSVALICGELLPNRRAGSLRVIVGGEAQARRGAGAGVSGAGGRCPLGQVVTGFEGARNFDGTTSEIRELTLHCAPLAPGDGSSVVIGTPSPAQPMSTGFATSSVPADEIMPLQSCPTGQVVRGAAVRAGTWVDGLSFVCGKLVLALPEGQACGSAIECQSGRCNGSCQPRPCAPPAGCTCALLEDVQYAFCPTEQTRPEAADLCAASGMQLAYAQDPIAHGWLRSSAAAEGIQTAFWLGADDLAGEGLWRWVTGGAVDLASELWDNDEQRGGPDENCMEMTASGHWDDVACALPLPFVCETAPL